MEVPAAVKQVSKRSRLIPTTGGCTKKAGWLYKCEFDHQKSILAFAIFGISSKNIAIDISLRHHNSPCGGTI